MTTQILFYALIAIAVAGFIVSRKRAQAYKRQLVSGNGEAMHSLPKYYGYYTAIWAGVPALLLLLGWIALENTVIDSALTRHIPAAMQSENMSLVLNDIKLAAATGDASGDMAQLADYYNAAKTRSGLLKSALVLLVALAGAFWGYTRFKPTFRARNRVEKSIRYGLLLCSFFAVITTVGIVASVIFESLVFFNYDDGHYSVSAIQFFFGTHWSPTGGEPHFGIIPLFVGTLLISAIALIIAVPTGLMAAIYLSEYASPRIRSVAKPILELLAGIPTVVYGFFAVLTIAPAFRNFGEMIGLNVASESALAAGVVMGVMIIPFISSLSDDAISAVPQYLRDGSFGLGGTQSETIKQVVLPAALPGIVGGILLAASRAIGETMIVVMAAGLSANMTVNPLQAVTTVTVQIVTALTGDTEFGSPKTLVAFALALVLFFVTLALNLFALRIVKKYREQYD